MTEPREGLRTLKKQMAREAIAHAALQLTLERGLANVTLDAVANLAFVSPRTVSNYFSCKEEAVVAAGNNFSGLIERVRQAPMDEHPLQLLRREITEFLCHRTPEELQKSREMLQMMEDNPSLRPHQVASYDDLERQLQAVLAERTGTDVPTDMYPWLVAASAMATTRIAMRVWAQAGADADALPDIIAAAFDHVATGLRPDADQMQSALPEQAVHSRMSSSDSARH
jgi:AcrR family transcriptional regulator